MKDVINILLAPAIAILLALCLTLASCSSAKNSSDNSTVNAATQTQNQTQSPPDLQKQRQEAEQQARPEIEQERKQAEDEASKNLDQEAMAAIDETQKAIDAIAANKTDQAMAAIEQATGKINILLARNPATALIPVSLEVDVIDAAPHDSKAIAEIAKNASKAMDDKNYPAARVLLYALTSEIRVRTYNLPLATYSAALQEAAHLLDQKKPPGGQQCVTHRARHFDGRGSCHSTAAGSGARSDRASQGKESDRQGHGTNAGRNSEEGN